jgi:hypothetical protein
MQYRLGNNMEHGSFSSTEDYQVEEEMEDDNNDKSYEYLEEEEEEEEEYEREGNNVIPEDNDESSEEEMVEDQQNQYLNGNGNKKVERDNRSDSSGKKICYVCNRFLKNNRTYSYHNENYKKFYDRLMDEQRRNNLDLHPTMNPSKQIVGDCCYRKARIMFRSETKSPQENKRKNSINREKEGKLIEPSSKRIKHSNGLENLEADLMPTTSTSNTTTPAKQQVNVTVYIFGTATILAVDPEISLDDFKREVELLTLHNPKSLRKLYLVQEGSEYRNQHIDALILPPEWSELLPLCDSLEFETIFW